MAQVDSTIALGLQPVKINDPMETYAKGLQLRSLIDSGQLNKLQYEQAARSAALDDSINQAWKDSVNTDGTIDREKLSTNIAQAGGGSKLPAIKKWFAESDRLGYEADLQKLKIAKEKTQQLGSLAGSALQMIKSGNINQVASVYGQAVRLGLMTQEEARQEMSGLNGSEPNAWAQHFETVQMASVDALEQIKLKTAKYEYLNTGKQYVPVDMNSITNPNPIALQMTTTPGQDQSNAATLRGQNMVDSRARASLSQAEDHFNRRTVQEKTQIVPTDDGVFIVNKGTGESRQVFRGDEKPMLPKGSPMYDGENKFNSALRTIEEAKKLLPNATGSRIGQGVDLAAAAFGKTTKGAEASDALKVLSGALISGVPRFKGSDSDKDVAIYKQLAGNIGDETIPYQRRLASLQQVEQMLKNNANQKGFIDKRGAVQAETNNANKNTEVDNSGPAKVKSDADFNALPSGSIFIGPDGKTRRKP